MDPNKWRIKKTGSVWRLFAPGVDWPHANGSWGYCVTRMLQLQRLNPYQQTKRWRDG